MKAPAYVGSEWRIEDQPALPEASATMHRVSFAGGQLIWHASHVIGHPLSLAVRWRFDNDTVWQVLEIGLVDQAVPTVGTVTEFLRELAVEHVRQWGVAKQHRYHPQRLVEAAASRR